MLKNCNVPVHSNITNYDGNYNLAETLILHTDPETVLACIFVLL